MSPTPVREYKVGPCSPSRVGRSALELKIAFRSGLGLEAAERMCGGADETGFVSSSGSVDVVDETSWGVLVDGTVVADFSRRCRSDSSNFG
jgi:hypothetical protein